MTFKFEDMKQLMTIFGLAIVSLFFNQATYAQELAPDQNPNYRVSMVKYMAVKDSLTSTMSTTVQDTYKAYDWYEAKLERKAQKKQWKHEERMARAKYGRSYSSYDNGYYGNYYNRYNSGWSNWNNWRPSIGFKTGNWWFSI
jgi:hypothetical protein